MHFSTWFAQVPTGVDYAVIFIVTLFEGTGLPGVPFEPVFLGAGYLIGVGRLGFVAAVAAGGGGNLAGNLLGYTLGALASRHLDANTAPRLGVTPERLERAKAWFRRWGGATVFVGRWFGPIRTPAILAAGGTGLSPAAYAAWSALAAVSWVSAWLWLTWKFGSEALVLWHRFGTRAAAAFLLVAAAAWIAWRLGAYRRLRRRCGR